MRSNSLKRLATSVERPVEEDLLATAAVAAAFAATATATAVVAPAMQITLQSPQAVQVLGGSKSNADGLVVLSDIKLRERPGNYTLQVSSTTDKSVPPAQASCCLMHSVHLRWKHDIIC